MAHFSRPVFFKQPIMLYQLVCILAYIRAVSTLKLQSIRFASLSPSLFENIQVSAGIYDPNKNIHRILSSKQVTSLPRLF